eukprot:GEZU01014026.1.p1 GENE.GEZU01014026.1~~GEZU01014026.1.p1  ORF type:complete len:266 (+),score=100.29 GEZU01014026.1:122-919(+)
MSNKIQCVRVDASNYLELSKIYEAEFIAVMQDKTGWQFIKEKKGVKIERKATNITAEGSNNTLNIVRGTTVVNCSPQHLFDNILMNPALQFWVDPYVKNRRLVTKFDAECEMWYYEYKSPPPVAHRDFLTFEVNKKVSDTHWISLARSCLCDDVPPFPKHYVRGEMLCSGYEIRVVEGQPDSCILSFVVQIDLKGSMPIFIVNKSTEDSPLQLALIKELAELGHLKSDSSKKPFKMIPPPMYHADASNNNSNSNGNDKTQPAVSD